MRLLASAAIIALVSACSPAAPPADTTTPPVETPAPSVNTNVITAEGWGPLHVGMTRAEVVAAVGSTLTPNAVGGADPQACDLFHPSNAPEGLLVMIQHDRLTSITLRNNTTLKTDRGFGVGDSAAAIKTVYGASAQSMPHRYAQGGEYITVWTVGAPPNASTFVQNPNARGVRYETDANGLVTAVHAGGDSIQNVEGCS